ncbi:Kinesin motor domain containing protein [Achlya hypogyna]|uniref:Kinesin motor domain containing protein n=1 Tax=Achlya hypogyna TaxID=1202772 RepID=A0A1V9ZEH7_ACHHY|nr:Kinesin motor domain containing protein [Achlya hypogyna]
MGPSAEFAAALFRIRIKQAGSDARGPAMYSTVDLYDLPALNRLSRPRNAAESPLLTKALYGIESVARALQDPSATPFPPYDTAELTQTLRQALGGDCRTLAFFVVVPGDFDGTKATLGLATLVQRIRNYPLTHTDMVEGMQRRYLRETQYLKGELDHARSASVSGDDGAVVLMQKNHELEGRCIKENLEKLKLREQAEALQKAVADYRGKYQALVEDDVGLRRQVLETEREKLRLSKALVELQLEQGVAAEAGEKDKFELTTKLLNAENDILELQLRVEELEARAKAATEGADKAAADKRELTIEFVALKANFVQLNASFQKEVAKGQQLGLELLTLVNQKKALAGRVEDLERAEKDAAEAREKLDTALDAASGHAQELSAQLSAEKTRSEALLKQTVELEFRVKSLTLEAEARQLQYEKAAQEAAQQHALHTQQLQQQALGDLAVAQARLDVQNEQLKTLTFTVRQRDRQVQDLETVVATKSRDVEALSQVSARQALELESQDRDYRAKLTQLLGAAETTPDTVVAELVQSFREKEQALAADLNGARRKACEWQRRADYLQDKVDDVPTDVAAWAAESAAAATDTGAELEVVRTKLAESQRQLHVQLEKNLAAAEGYKALLGEKERELTRLQAALASAEAERDRLLARADTGAEAPNATAELRRVQDTLVQQIQELRQLHAAKQTDAVELSVALRELQKENDRLKKLVPGPDRDHLAVIEDTERRCAELTTKNIMLAEELASLKQLLKRFTTVGHR